MPMPKCPRTAWSPSSRTARRCSGRPAGRPREFGYTRMWSIHPGQIEPLIEAFAPSVAEVDEAIDIIHAAQGRPLGTDPAPRDLARPGQLPLFLACAGARPGHRPAPAHRGAPGLFRRGLSSAQAALSTKSKKSAPPWPRHTVFTRQTPQWAAGRAGLSCPGVPREHSPSEQPPLRPHPGPLRDRRRPDRADVLAAPAAAAVSADRPPADLPAHRAGIGAAALRQPRRHARACGATGPVAGAARSAAQRRDPHGRGPRGAAGLHRRALAGRPGRHAPGGRRAGPGAQTHRAAGAGGPGGRPLGDDRPLRLAPGPGSEHEAGVRAQPRALPVHEMGHAGL